MRVSSCFSPHHLPYKTHNLPQRTLLHVRLWGPREETSAGAIPGGVMCTGTSRSIRESGPPTRCEMRATCLLQPRRAPAGAVWDARGCCAALGRRTCGEWQCRWPSATPATWTSPSRPAYTNTRGQTHQNKPPADISSVKRSPCNLTCYFFFLSLF